ncbi:hypothetical protein [Endozoicomonas acroporae]|uniref:hypothetical protein n=1 Tax=Endozoicomonas acroporae TaxID=1701104 RepID=UPI003D7AFBCA
MMPVPTTALPVRAFYFIEQEWSMNLIEIIAAGANDELEDSEHQSELLTEIYENASEQEQKKIDEVLVCICGWQFSSLKGMEDS